jgi:putative oxidoreductase
VLRGAVLAYDRLVAKVSGPAFEGAALLLTRFALAGVFWRSGRSKVDEGSWLTISDSTQFLFSTDYANVPLPPELAAVLATGAEHLLPGLLVLGLATRLSALALLGMTMTIQLFVYPDAWWPVHSLWSAMCLVLIARGSGLLGLDQLLLKARQR